MAYFPEPDLKSLSERLRAIADKLRHLPPNHPELGDLLPPLIKEVKAITAELLRQH